MTAINHRFHFPNDVVGTLATGSPILFSQADQRYYDYLQTVGGNEHQQCREDIKKLQVELFKNKAEILKLMAPKSELVGGKSWIFDRTVHLIPLFFWGFVDPYDPQKGCASMPLGASATEQYSYLQGWTSFDSVTDSGFIESAPVNYLMSNEFGYPALSSSHFEYLKSFDFARSRFVPSGIPLNYSNSSMRTVNDWLKSRAERVVLIYVQFEFWSGGAFEAEPNTRDVNTFWIPKRNHRFDYIDLPHQELLEFRAMLSAWLGRSPVLPPTPAHFPVRLVSPRKQGELSILAPMGLLP